MVADGPFVADICRKLDGIPLAIEFAAAPSITMKKGAEISSATDASLPRRPRGAQCHDSAGAGMSVAQAARDF
jgi:predicted ATPase